MQRNGMRVKVGEAGEERGEDGRVFVDETTKMGIKASAIHRYHLYFGA